MQSGALRHYKYNYNTDFQFCAVVNTLCKFKTCAFKVVQWKIISFKVNSLNVSAFNHSIIKDSDIYA